MMDWTDRHCRWFHRQLSQHIWLYTEMVVADAVIHGDRSYLIGFDDCEHPVVLQIGGSDPQKLAEAARIGADYGYDEININIGCPSDRVQSGRFGACLMADPALVARCFEAMQQAVDIPVTIKCRLGIDDQVPEATLPDFLRHITEAGCQRVIIHARKAWLEGLSPKDNRNIPPLDYALVVAMKQAFPQTAIELNGGLESLKAAMTACHPAQGLPLDGFMLGRAAYHNPWLLSAVDPVLFGGEDTPMTRDDIVRRLIDYAQMCEASNQPCKALLRHVMGLYAAQPGARQWRRVLSEQMAMGRTPSQALQSALKTRREEQAGGSALYG